MFVDYRCNFPCNAAGSDVFMQKNYFVGLAHGLRNRVAIKRREGSQIENLQFDSFLRQNAGSLLRNMHHGGIRDDAQVLTLADNASFAQRDKIILRRYLFFNAAVKVLVLEEYNWVVIAN